tara:strand:- start:387 stop:731 length:345 start_codon:yes stop_codon:yes gene_type:complete
MKLLSVLAVGMMLAGPVSASIHLCSEWSDGGLRHRGDVIVSLDGSNLTWKAEASGSTAFEVSKRNGAATYSDGNYIYFVFGILGFEPLIPTRIDLIRRVAMTRNSGFGEITCEE